MLDLNFISCLKDRIMKEGTISVLVGCHSVIHSFLVWKSWRHVNGRYPKLWEIGCIFLHDIGHWGKDYLSDIEQKKQHWKLGALIAHRLFGVKGYYLCAGHVDDKNNELFKADKYSWYIAPEWWLYTSAILEPKLRCGKTLEYHVNEFKNKVASSIETGEYRNTHDIFMEMNDE
jgi:hypothetical protein